MLFVEHSMALRLRPMWNGRICRKFAYHTSHFLIWICFRHFKWISVVACLLISSKIQSRKEKNVKKPIDWFDDWVRLFLWGFIRERPFPKRQFPSLSRLGYDLKKKFNFTTKQSYTPCDLPKFSNKQTKKAKIILI